MIRNDPATAQDDAEILAALELIKGELGNSASTHAAQESTFGNSNSESFAPNPDLSQIEHCLRQLALHRDELRLAALHTDAISNAASQQEIDRFRIIRELGRGGCGVVLLVEDPELGRKIALKVPHPAALVSPEMQRRFVTEARAAAALEHPGIIRVYEVGSTGPLSWIAMEYCAGCTLQAYLERNKTLVPVAAAADLIRQVALAIDYAHVNGIVHRDLKPANILLDYPSVEQPVSTLLPELPKLERCQAKLTDFGLAKILTESGDATMTLMPMGTPTYMSPEQIGGRSALIGPPSDLYSLGIVLYEMLTGVPAFRGSTKTETWRHILYDDPQAISVFRADVPRDLQAIVRKAIEKEPAARYSTAAALAADLNRFLQGEPTLARPLSPPARLWRWTQRHPTAAGIITTLLASAFLLIAGGIWHLNTIESELEINRQLRATSESRLGELQHGNYVRNLQLAKSGIDEAKLDSTLSLLNKCIPLAGEPDQRDFLWHHLWHRCHHEKLCVTAHDATVAALVYSPDGTTLISGGHDGRIVLTEPKTGRVLRTLAGHEGNINTLAFAGSRLISGADDGCMIVWDCATGAQLLKKKCEAGDLLCLAIHPHKPWVATGGVDGVIRLWNFETGEKYKEFAGKLPAEPLWIRDLEFTPDGERLVSAGHDSFVNCWDVPSGALIWQYFTIQRLHALAMNSHTNHLYAAGHSGTIYEFDIANGELVDKIASGLDWIRTLTISPNARQLAVTAKSGRVRIWDCYKALTPDSRFDFAAHDQEIWALAFSADQGHFATGSSDHTVKIWENEDCFQNGFDVWNFESIGRIRSTQFDFNTGVVTVAGTDAWVHIHLRDFGYQVSRSAWPHDKQSADVDRKQLQILLSAPSEPLEVFDLQQRTTRKHELRMESKDFVAWRPHQPEIGFFRKDKPFQLLSYPDLRIVTEYETSSNKEPYHFMFSPTGRYAALQDTDPQQLQVVDLERPNFQWFTPAIKVLPAFSADDTLLAIGQLGETIKLYELPTLRELHHFGGKKSALSCLAISPDKRLLAVGYLDESLDFWDIRTGTQVMKFAHGHGVPKYIAFSDDCRQMIVLRQSSKKTHLCLYADFQKPYPY